MQGRERKERGKGVEERKNKEGRGEIREEGTVTKIFGGKEEGRKEGNKQGSKGISKEGGKQGSREGGNRKEGGKERKERKSYKNIWRA